VGNLIVDCRIITCFDLKWIGCESMDFNYVAEDRHQVQAA